MPMPMVRMWMWMWMWMSLLVVWTRLSLPVFAYLLTDARNARSARSGLGKAPAFARSIRHSMARDDNNNDLAGARRLVADGMDAFRNGQVEKSIDLFDQAESVAPSLTPYLWQRGLSYYYADRFDAASRQFRVDVQVNPNDAEEIVWDIASQLRLHHDKFPVPSQLQLPRKDPRRIMSIVYRLFRGEGTEYELMMAAQSGSASDAFYGLFYLGLYNEARFYNQYDNVGNGKAAGYMRQALQTPYAVASNDYMVACARVHAQRRGWTM